MTFQFKYHREGGPVRICRYEFQYAYIVLHQPPPRFANIGNSNLYSSSMSSSLSLSLRPFPFAKISGIPSFK